MVALKWITDRLKERSTWLGLIAVLGSLGVAVKPELSEAIVGLGVALAGFIAVITKDKTPA